MDRATVASALVLSGCFVASLAACGNGTAATAVTANPTATATPASAPPVSAAPPSDAIPSAASRSVAPATQAATGADLCALLSPADFATLGVDGAGDPRVTTDESGTFCVYAGTSGASGGIELDFFANPDEATAKETYATAIGEAPQGSAPAGSPFDDASIYNDGEVIYLTARQGRLVLALAAPNDMNVDISLVELAKLAFERAADLQ